MKIKVDKTLTASIVLHVLVLGWGLVSFSTKAFVMPEEDVVAVSKPFTPGQLREAIQKAMESRYVH